MTDSEGRVDRDAAVIGIAASAEQGAYYTVLVRWAAGTVIKDAEEGLRLDLHCEGGGGRLNASTGWAQWPG